MQVLRIVITPPILLSQGIIFNMRQSYNQVDIMRCAHSPVSCEWEPENRQIVDS